MQQKEETMISLYQLLGRIFYAAAQADDVIQDKEVTTLKTIVRDVWLDFEDALDLHGSDAAYQIEIVFDFLLENEVQVEDVMNEVREFKNIHSSVFTEKLTELIMATSYQIASSFARRNKSELVFLSQLRNVLEK